MKNFSYALKLLVFISLSNSLLFGQQIEHFAPTFNFGGNQSLMLDDFIARDNINMEPSSQAFIPYSGTQINLKIDKYQQYPLTYQKEASYTETDPQAESIDIGINTNLPVGSISGSAGVSSSGSASYDLSIYTPPGTNGMVPQIGVYYNSSSADGLLGRGWNISGISSITRVPKTIYHNGKMEGIQLDNTDPIALDGNRLIASPVNGMNTFRPERENFSLISTLMENGNEYFTVQTKEGLTMEYGRNVDSKLVLKDANNIDITLTWYLNKVIDNYGNYMTYSYNNEGGEVTLKEIAYTCNAGIVPYNYIRFYYDKRKDENTFYLLGNALKSSLIVREIEIFCEGKSMKRYKFNYVYNLQSFLREVTEYGADNTHLNSTFFKYGGSAPIEKNIRTAVPPDPNQGINDLEFTAGPIEIENSIIGDFNGDGTFDQVELSPFNTSQINLQWQLWLNKKGVLVEANATNSNYPANGTINNFRKFEPSDYFSIDTTTIDGKIINANTGLVIGSSRSPVRYAQAIDMNGDGLDDIVFVHNISSTNQNEILIYYSNGSGFTPGPTKNFETYAALIFADIDGNGIPEGILYDFNEGLNPKSQFCVLDFYASTTPTLICNTAHTTISGIQHPYKNFSVMDFDGDGKFELQAGSVIIKLDYNGTSLTTSEMYILNINMSYTEVLRGDFNGDGLIDFLYPKKIFMGSEWHINGYFMRCNSSKGLIHIPDVIYMPYNALAVPDYKVDMLTIDLNNDGNDDILRVADNGYDRINFSVFYSGRGAEVSIGYINRAGAKNPADYMTALSYDGLHGTMVLDFDGDGFKDILYEEKGVNFGIISSVIQFNRNSSMGLLKEIQDGTRFKTKLNYSTLTSETNGFYQKSSDAQYPVVDISPASFALENIVTDDGIGGTNVTSFKYRGLKTHLGGLGILGFKENSSYNSISKVRKVTEFEFKLPYYERYNKKVKIFKTKGSTESLNYESIYTPNWVDMGNLRFFSYIAFEENINHLADYTSTVDYEYDTGNNGILTKRITQINGNLQVTQENFTVETTPCGSWMPSKILSAVSTTTRNGGGTYSRKVNYHYKNYSTTGELDQIITDLGSPYETTTEIEYYASGQLKKTIKNGVGNVQTITNQLVYDDKERFIISASNTLNQIVENKYDPRWGKVIWQKGIDNNVSEAFYDGYGNLMKTISPDNTISTTKTNWTDVNEISSIHPFNVKSKALFTVSQESSGYPSSKAFLDAFGRELLSVSESYNKTIYQAHEYSKEGNVAKSTGTYDDDFLSGSNSYTTIMNEFEYDEFNRTTKVTATDGAAPEHISTYEYDFIGNGELKVTSTTPDDKQTIKIRDAAGLLVAATDNNGGILHYTYHGSGQIEAVTLGSSNLLTTAVYDVLGKQSSFLEENSSLIGYTYDAYGRVIAQIQDNKTYNFTYNVLSQLETKSGPEGLYQYEYYGSGNGINQVHFIKSPNDLNVQEFNYDKLNRLIEKIEKINQIPYTSNYKYGEFNRLKQLAYPSGFAVDYLYDSKGFMQQIKRADNGTSIWKADEMNHLGQITKYTLGNKPQSLNSYTNFGLPIETKTAGIQDLYYDFDPLNGNMLQRKDLMRNLEENFTYTDGLDRLNSMQVVGQTKHDISYLPNGNIESKSQLGLYTYDIGGKPNAVLSVENSNNKISSNEQTIIYTAFNKVQHMEEGDFILDYTYGGQEERKISILSDANHTELCKRLYLEGFEKTYQNGNIYEVTYIDAPTGLAAMFVRENGNEGTMHYVYSDNLGSINTLIDDAGNKIEQSFDAWGNQRNTTDWSELSLPLNLPVWLYRGYTGHEYLKEFALINMNGRMYDPILGRMLSPDPFLQDGENSQNYNRYSYVLNNPLKYSDPSGYNYNNQPSIRNYNESEGSASSWGKGGTGFGGNGAGKHRDAEFNEEGSGAKGFENIGLSQFQIAYSTYFDKVMAGEINPSKSVMKHTETGYWIESTIITEPEIFVNDDGETSLTMPTVEHTATKVADNEEHGSKEILQATLVLSAGTSYCPPLAIGTFILGVSIAAYVHYFPPPTLQMSRSKQNIRNEYSDDTLEELKELYKEAKESGDSRTLKKLQEEAKRRGRKEGKNKISLD